MATVYTLDLTPNWSYTETVTVSQDDVGREIEFDLTIDGATYAIPSGATVTMHGTKPSGLGFTVTGSFTANDDAVTFSTTEGMTQEYGRFPAEIVITSSGTVIGTANFDLWVEKSPHPSSTTDGTAQTLYDLETRVTALENTTSSGLDATGVTADYVPTAQGDNTWEWEAQSGGGSTVTAAQGTLSSGLYVGKVTVDGAEVKMYAYNPSLTSLTNSSRLTLSGGGTAYTLEGSYGAATTSAAGLMSATDKSNLDSVYADYSSALAAVGVS